MKTRLCNYLLTAAGVLAFVSGFSGYGRAQQTSAQQAPIQQNGQGASGPGDVKRRSFSHPLPAGGPTPRLADGHPDLSGIWFEGMLGKDTSLVSSFGPSDPNIKPFDPKVTPEEKPSFQPGALKRFTQHDGYLLTNRNDSVSLSKLPKDQQIAAIDFQITKLTRNCMPHGVPGMTLEGVDHTMELVETPEALVQIVEENHDYRVIPTDGRAHTKNPDPKFDGESVAHWEGDTLVIDTIAIDDRVWNSDEWTFHSEDEHVIERFSRPSLNYLTYQVTVEDPKVLTKPWTSAPHRYSLSVTPHESLAEWYCGVNGHEDEEIQALKERKKQLEEEK